MDRPKSRLRLFLVLAAALAPAVLPAASEPSGHEEPTTMAQVKTIIVRFDSSSSVAGFVQTELESRLLKLGIAVTTNEVEADAELVLTALQRAAGQPQQGGILGGIKSDVTASARILSLPSHHVLFATTKGAMDDEFSDACRETASGIAKAIKKDRETRR